MPKGALTEVPESREQVVLEEAMAVAGRVAGPYEGADESEERAEVMGV